MLGQPTDGVSTVFDGLTTPQLFPSFLLTIIPISFYLDVARIRG